MEESARVVSSSRMSPVGHHGRVTGSGAIRPGQLGEVMIAIRGGVEAYLAHDADGGSVDPYEEIVVVDQTGPQTVMVTRLYDSQPDSGAPLP